MKNYAYYLGIDGWDVRHFTPDKVKSLKVGGHEVKEEFDFICAVKWAGAVSYTHLDVYKRQDTANVFSSQGGG